MSILVETTEVRKQIGVCGRPKSKEQAQIEKVSYSVLASGDQAVNLGTMLTRPRADRTVPVGEPLEFHHYQWPSLIHALDGFATMETRLKTPGILSTLCVIGHYYYCFRELVS